MIKFQIRESHRYDDLVRLFMSEGLEFSEDDLAGNSAVPTDIIKCWEITVAEETDVFAKNADEAEETHVEHSNTPGMNDEKERIVGGAVLAKRQGEYIVDGIAMAKAFQKAGLGKELMMRLIEETLNLRGDAIYLVARAPGFFGTIGFETVDREDAPEFFECTKCPQRGVSCHPEVMKLQLT